MIADSAWPVKGSLRKRSGKGRSGGVRRALILGGKVSLPELYAAVGARFAFDAETLRTNVALIERVIAELEPVARG